MEKKHIFFGLILIVISAIGFYIFHFTLQKTDSPINTSKPSIQSEQPTVNLSTKGAVVGKSDKVWNEWIEDQTTLMKEELFRRFREELPYVGPPELAFDVVDVEETFRKEFKAKAEELKKKGENPPPLRVYDFSGTTDEPSGPKPHMGPQTVDALLTSFEDMAADPMIDGKYPQDEWVAMLLDKGVTIEHFGDYSRYLTIRGNLISLENRSGEWTSGRYGIPPTEDWETYKAAYIDRKIWENQQIQNAQKTDPTIDGGIFRGPDARTFLPTGGGRYYVKRYVSEHGIISASSYGGYMSSEDSYNLFVKGIEPKGYQIIYLDDKNNVLAEPPSTISPEEYHKKVVNKDSQNDPSAPLLPSDFSSTAEDVVPQDRDRSTFPRKKSEEEIAAQAARRIVQQAQAELKSLGQIFRTNTEWQSFFEQSLIPTAEVPPLKRTEAILTEQYPERFDKAVNLIYLHGLEEGIRRLRSLDSDVAVHLENWFRAAHIERKNASR